MNHYGKILGFILGWLALRHPAGAVLGLILGHVLDAGWLRGRGAAGTSAATETETETEAYGLLGVDPAASDEDVHAAYRKRISEYHPDKVQNAAQEIRELAEQRARSINQAYESILKMRRARRPD